MRNSVAKAFLKIADNDPRAFLITGDAGFGVWDDYQQRRPERFLNMGVAEQNTISFGAGLAMTGFKVFIYNIVPFVLYRCFEQVRNDICYQEQPVVLIGIGCGLAYAPAGMTHYSIEDLAIARSLPNLTVISPADPTEATAAMDFAYRATTPVYIRIGKGGEPVLPGPAIENLARPRILREGDGVAVIFHGSVGGEVLKAVEALGQSVRVISLPMVQPIDDDALDEALRGIHTLLSVEEHYIDCGLGSHILGWIGRNGRSLRCRTLGVPRQFVHEIHNHAGMRKAFGLDAAGIQRQLAELIDADAA